jgi:hypothetical protein
LAIAETHLLLGFVAREFQQDELEVNGVMKQSE